MYVYDMTGFETEKINPKLFQILTMNDKGNLNFLFACTISELSLVSCSILGFDLFDNQIIHISSSVDGKMSILGINVGTILGPFDDRLWALKNFVKLKYILQKSK